MIELGCSIWIQYTALHENLFLFTCSESEHDVPNLPPLRKGDEKGDDSFHFFDEPAHDIVSEFGVRYGIESIYGAMTHFSCLATKYMCQGVPSIMTQLLEHIIEFYTSTTFTQITPSKRFSSSNFGSGRFLRLLEQLHNSLRIDISSYRENFPATNSKWLENIVNEIAKAAWIPLIFNHLNWNPSQLRLEYRCNFKCNIFRDQAPWFKWSSESSSSNWQF